MTITRQLNVALIHTFKVHFAEFHFMKMFLHLLKLMVRATEQRVTAKVFVHFAGLSLQ
jgi:hypothetical protein